MKDRGSDVVRVGNGQAFWGDSPLGPPQLVARGGIDYLTMDFLAEVTMSILQKARRRRPDTGYAADFVDIVERVLPDCQTQGIKIIANAGGVNPAGCAEAVAAAVRRLGLRGVRIGVVAGDDLLPRLDELLAAGEEFTNLDTGEPLAPRRPEVLSANAYLGAAPIVAALAEGADVVITGRVADASLTVAPLVHTFGWSFADLDRLAAATAAGHIIECGTQCTGGNFDGWEGVGDLTDVGYPIVEAGADGSFVVTKPPGTGGAVTPDTVIAQILYEIGDPARYLTPDVVADFSGLRVTQDGPDRVAVRGARGAAPTPTYKVSLSTAAGYKAVGQLVVGGPRAAAKAELTARLLWDRLAADGTKFSPDQRLVELLGTGVVVPPAGGAPAFDAPEVVLRVGVRDHDRVRVDRFGRELASLLTSGPPGLTGFAGGRPKASEVVAFWPALVAKDRVAPEVSVWEVQ